MIERYSRQVAFWGSESQSKIESSKIFVAGVGGLGSVLSVLLVRAGVREICLIDNGVVDLPDLNRQILYYEKDLGKSKVEIAKERLLEINPNIKIKTINSEINESFIMPNSDYIVADCLDNFRSRFILYNSIKEKSFYIHGGVDAETGQVITIQKGNSPDFEDIFAGLVDSNKIIPVTPDSVSMVASVMAREIFYTIIDKSRLLDKFWIISFEDFYSSYMEI